MNKIEVFEKIANQAKQGVLAFPTGAQSAMKLHRALDNPDCSIETATKLIQSEPLLAAKIIAIANSVVYNRSGREIIDIRVSISRLGFGVIRSLAMALLTSQMAGKPVKLENQKLVQQLWEHSAHVASLANVIARHVTRQDPEIAMFAGIVHEIGGFYMLSCAEKFPGLLNEDFTDWLEVGEVMIGRAVMEKLEIPESVTLAIETFWEGFLSMPPNSLADTLLLAEELCPVPSPLHQLPENGSSEQTSASIDMVIGQETLALILSEAAEEVRSLKQALQL